MQNDQQQRRCRAFHSLSLRGSLNTVHALQTTRGQVRAICVVNLAGAVGLSGAQASLDFGKRKRRGALSWTRPTLGALHRASLLVSLSFEYRFFFHRAIERAIAHILPVMRFVDPGSIRPAFVQSLRCVMMSTGTNARS